MKTISIKDSAQTVIDLYVHFAELKSIALEIREETQAIEKGYFSPNEEQQTKHLLITYLYSRSALFELILELKDQLNSEKLGEEEKDQYFLIGYSAALILVYAAQFLFKTFDDIPIVRAKLNEADKHLGIPKNSYNDVIQSLIETENVLDIYYARKYYEKHAKSFSKFTKGQAHLLELMKITQSLNDEIKIGKRGFLKMSTKVNFRKVVKEIENFTVNQAQYRLQEIASRAISRLSTAPYHQANLPEEIRKSILEVIQPGDIFITRKEYALTNYFLPGYWPHASLYLGDSTNHKVLESLKDGVKVRPIESAFSVDSIVILRPQISKEEVDKAIKRGLSHKGKPYDFDFDFKRSDRLVCTEVIYRCFDGIGNIHFELNDNFGRKNFTTDEMLQNSLLGEMLKPIGIFSPKHQKKLLLNDKAEALLRKIIHNC
jgi:uncharacterized protein YycO